MSVSWWVCTPISLNALSPPSNLFIITYKSETNNPASLSWFIPFKTDVPVVITSSTITTFIPADILPSIDFVVHAIAFSDRSELSGEYLNTTRENFLKSMLISCFSFTEIAKEASKIMKEGGSMLTLTYESTKVIPNYNVMGVCKSALETSVKYLARDLGEKKIRVNAISAGPIKTLAASAIGDAKFLYKWNEDHSLLKRNVDIDDIGNSALYLLSDLAGAVTGEIHYVDAGYNKVGMPNPKNMS